MCAAHKVQIIAVILLLVPIAALASDKGNAFQKGYVELISNFLCVDPEYLKCLEVVRSKCVASLYSASLKCDISEFEASVNKDDVDIMELASLKYSFCITENFVSIANIKKEKWETCPAPDITPMPNNAPQPTPKIGAAEL